MALTNIWRASIQGLWDGKSQTVNVLHYRPALINLNPTAEALANVINEIIIPQYRACISSRNLVEKIVVVPAVGDDGGFELGVNLNGTGGSDTVTAQQAAIVSWKTAKRGRSFRGRTYLPPCSEGVIDGNFTAAYLTTLGDFATAAMQPTSLGVFGAWQLVIASYTKDEANDVVSYVTPLYPGVQRRRRPGSGS